MTDLKLPAPPQGISSIKPGPAQPLLLIWLMTVAEKCGEDGVEFAVGSGWPGTFEQRAWISAAHVALIRSHARQLTVSS